MRHAGLFDRSRCVNDRERGCGYNRAAPVVYRRKEGSPPYGGRHRIGLSVNADMTLVSRKSIAMDFWLLSPLLVSSCVRVSLLRSVVLNQNVQPNRKESYE